MGGVYLVRPSGTISWVPWCCSFMWLVWWSPPDVVMFYEDMAEFSSDGGGFSKFDGGLVVFVDDGG